MAPEEERKYSHPFLPFHLGFLSSFLLINRKHEPCEMACDKAVLSVSSMSTLCMQSIFSLGRDDLNLKAPFWI